MFFCVDGLGFLKHRRVVVLNKCCQMTSRMYKTEMSRDNSRHCSDCDLMAFEKIASLEFRNDLKQM